VFLATKGATLEAKNAILKIYYLRRRNRSVDFYFLVSRYLFMENMTTVIVILGIYGQLVDSAGNPLRNCAIRIGDYRRDIKVSPNSAFFHVTLPSGPYAITVRDVHRFAKFLKNAISPHERNYLLCRAGTLPWI